MAIETDRWEAARKRLAEMQARMAPYMPHPKVENGIQRGEKHSDRVVPLGPKRAAPKWRRS